MPTDSRFDELVKRVEERGGSVHYVRESNTALVKISKDYAIQIETCNVLEIKTVHLALDSLDHEAAVDRVIEALEKKIKKAERFARLNPQTQLQGHSYSEGCKHTAAIVRREFGRKPDE